MNRLGEYLLIVIGTMAIVFGLGMLAVRAVQWARRRPVSVGAFAWSLMFLRSGDIPPPTPQEQTDQENREKKNRGASY